jgi:hypothetical protein
MNACEFIGKLEHTVGRRVVPGITRNGISCSQKRAIVAYLSPSDALTGQQLSRLANRSHGPA